MTLVAPDNPSSHAWAMRTDFPVDALPPVVANMVMGVARQTQTDPAMAAVVGLGVLATAAGGRVRVQVRPGWVEPVNLFLAAVAAPGERKSAVQRMMRQPLDAAEATLGEVLAVDDVTPQALTQLLAQQGRVGLFSAEGGWVNSLERSSGPTGMDVVLKGHAGDPIRVRRVTVGPLDSRHPTCRSA